MNFISLFFGSIFIIAGIVFAFGKVHIRLSAWKNMSDEEKQKIKIIPLCRNLGAVIVLCGIIFLLNGLIKEFNGVRFVATMIAWFVLAGVDLWYISKSKRYSA